MIINDENYVIKLMEYINEEWFIIKVLDYFKDNDGSNMLKRLFNISIPQKVDVKIQTHEILSTLLRFEERTLEDYDFFETFNSKFYVFYLDEDRKRYFYLHIKTRDLKPYTERLLIYTVMSEYYLDNYRGDVR